MPSAPKFAEVKAEYANLWHNMKITDHDEVEQAANKALDHKDRYQHVEAATGVPWPVIAALHMRESGADFKTYLGNGERLDRKTRLVPKGRGPFKDWETGAIDALQFDSLDDVMTEDWTIEMAAYGAEKYNGFGPRWKGINTGYLWSKSNNYSKGKYVADSRWSAKAIDQQVGVMPMLKRMMELDPSITFPPALTHVEVPKTTPTQLQDRLTAMGLLDPPSDGVIGSVTRWALKAAGVDDDITVATADIAMEHLSAKAALPLAPGNDLAGRIVSAAKEHDFWIARHKDCCNIFYIEGMDEDGSANANTPNQFNDLRVVIRCTAAGVPKIVGQWQATTEPSRYWTLRPMNPGGAARIAFGQWKCWNIGTHHNSHEALVQTAPLTVYRDKNKDYSRLDDVQDTGLFGINQHWGYDLPKNDLGNSSAGCLVGRMKKGHREFMALIKQDARYKAAGGSYKFMTTIMPAHWVIEGEV
jgi:lysozyme family protein